MSSNQIEYARQFAILGIEHCQFGKDFEENQAESMEERVFDRKPVNEGTYKDCIGMIKCSEKTIALARELLASLGESDMEKLLEKLKKEFSPHMVEVFDLQIRGHFEEEEGEE